ncbi:MAG: hypothetical protein Sylvanvirus1_99 [Sylvanvirus sp.]|uniref:Uncharacterized protein n=1 Tax=Sylvanvirus sp. TaxID=2487774 RepID=A0A3G5AK37_9VIRU|nr:MAG: hypothetical protein Sylvanvirus1_99 [Sylvanvirus sp.]
MVAIPSSFKQFVDCQFDEATQLRLFTAIKNHKNMVFVGIGGSGKSTLMKLLCNLETSEEKQENSTIILYDPSKSKEGLVNLLEKSSSKIPTKRLIVHSTLVNINLSIEETHGFEVFYFSNPITLPDIELSHKLSSEKGQLGLWISNSVTTY